jgi:hypothetical protein
MLESVDEPAVVKNKQIKLAYLLLAPGSSLAAAAPLGTAFTY